MAHKYYLFLVIIVFMATLLLLVFVWTERSIIQADIDELVIRKNAFDLYFVAALLFAIVALVQLITVFSDVNNKSSGKNSYTSLDDDIEIIFE